MQRYDYDLIASWIPEGSRVLDLGCGDGVLLAGLTATHGVSGYGIEIDDANVLASVKHGVNVVQADIESGLASFADGAFDFVILSQTLQAMRNAESVLNAMLRVGREGIVTFPNFGYWRHRLDILRGHMPVSKALPYGWYDTPTSRTFAPGSAPRSSTSACCTKARRSTSCRTSSEASASSASAASPRLAPTAG